MTAPKLVDLDWKIAIVTDAQEKAQSNKLKISVKLVLDIGKKENIFKYIDFTPEQFFEFYKNIGDCKSILEMAV